MKIKLSTIVKIIQVLKEILELIQKHFGNQIEEEK